MFFVSELPGYSLGAHTDNPSRKVLIMQVTSPTLPRWPAHTPPARSPMLHYLCLLTTLSP